MMKIKGIISLGLLLGLMSCSSMKNSGEQEVSALAWTQNAAEFSGLYLQAYNVATMRLDSDIKYYKSPRKRAVVLDVDETVLDNSPYQAKNILEGRTYTDENWDEWIQLADAKAVPGAKDFLDFAQKNGIEIFYISNRKTSQIDATYKNLVAQNLPVKRQNMYFRSETNSKVARRAKVLKNFRIVLLIGDQLGDFTDGFKKKTNEERRFLVKKMKKRLGKKFILMPNLMYGAWENAMFNYTRGFSKRKKDRIRRANLYPY